MQNSSFLDFSFIECWRMDNWTSHGVVQFFSESLRTLSEVHIWAFSLQKLVSMGQLGVWTDHSLNQSGWVVLGNGELWRAAPSPLKTWVYCLILELFLFSFCLFLFFLLPAPFLIFVWRFLLHGANIHVTNHQCSCNILKLPSLTLLTGLNELGIFNQFFWLFCLSVVCLFSLSWIVSV